MEALLKKLLAEQYQMSEHKQHGELHIYIDENHEDLERLHDQLIEMLSTMLKGGEQHAA